MILKMTLIVQTVLAVGMLVFVVLLMLSMNQLVKRGHHNIGEKEQARDKRLRDDVKHRAEISDDSVFHDFLK